LQGSSPAFAAATSVPDAVVGGDFAVLVNMSVPADSTAEYRVRFIFHLLKL